ncbi:nuclear transport factor 2 family protein [Streptomyces sp. NBC_01795]|uniref:nuclear transport factor 2 family protein n=1 Tax=unclassified Streptomyces TaxID=2593676 RepID=UPI002DDC1B41|nr:MULTISPECIES: nuclear transport factor 2 family protein [unclassified Streptomyces]WSA90573.1 nuclear transport factor 2 family protein [Streptomyces sp. NBC_01795]WSB74898.1 nuclear transport factor 2 family protein [Streptomyces sp. NBC_01775]WSS16821.1 nuclear transport factor 2 family protein [Streptomyces sp. NBC_01186]
MVTPADQDDAGSRSLALVVGGHHDIEEGRATAEPDVFADDAEFEAHGRVFRGRSEILDFLRAREADTARQTVHVLANEVTTAQAGGPHGKSVQLPALILLHVWQPDGAYVLDRVLNTTHQFRRAGGKWRITRRTSRPLHPTVDGQGGPHDDDDPPDRDRTRG